MLKDAEGIHDMVIGFAQEINDLLESRKTAILHREIICPTEPRKKYGEVFG